MAVGERVAKWSGVTISLVEGDIASLDVDAVVNAANDLGWMGSGVAGAIKRAGGPGIETEARAKAPGRPGTAWATTAGRLPARHVIHAAAMGQDLRTDADLVEAATRAAIAVARDLGVRTLALPALGTGVGGFPLREAARVMGTAVAEELATDPGALGEVVFAVFGDEAREAFAAVLPEVGAR